MNKLFTKVKKLAGFGYAALFALTVSVMVPSAAYADAISDAITDFDTSNILTAGAAVIGLVITIVGIRKVISMIKSA